MTSTSVKKTKNVLYTKKDDKSEYSTILDNLFLDSQIRKMAQEKLLQLSLDETEDQQINQVLDEIITEENICITKKERQEILSDINRDLHNMF